VAGRESASVRSGMKDLDQRNGRVVTACLAAICPPGRAFSTRTPRQFFPGRLGHGLVKQPQGRGHLIGRPQPGDHRGDRRGPQRKLQRAADRRVPCRRQMSASDLARARMPAEGLR